MKKRIRLYGFILVLFLMLVRVENVMASESSPDIVVENTESDEDTEDANEEQEPEQKPEIKANLKYSKYAYTGKKIIPKFTVKLSDGSVADKSLYTVKYETASKNVGKHRIVITPSEACATRKKIVLEYKIFPKKTQIKGVTKGLRKMTLKWQKNGVQNDGYIIKYSRNSNMDDYRSKTIKNVSTTSKTLENFITNKKYYFQIRCYKKVNGITYYSGWSDKKVYTTIKSSVNLPESDTKMKTVTHRDTGDILILVNKKHAVSEEFYPKNMITVPGKYSTKDNIKLKEVAYDAYVKMTKAAQKKGNYFYITSGYRSYTYQENLYANYLSKYGKNYTNKMSAYPGKSEHHTGLAIDVTSSSVGWELTDKFANTKEGKWIKSNAHKYGFIIRYGKNKTSITGYTYEPWHLRYVGTTAASKIYNQNITLEEYLNKK